MAEDYIHQDYPSVRFHPDGRVATVNTADEEKALGSGWHKSPAEYGVETCPAAPVVTGGTLSMPGYPKPAEVAAQAADEKALAEARAADEKTAEEASSSPYGTGTRRR